MQENRERDYGQKETGYQGCPLTRCIYGNKMRILQKAYGFLSTQTGIQRPEMVGISYQKRYMLTRNGTGKLPQLVYDYQEWYRETTQIGILLPEMV